MYQLSCSWYIWDLHMATLTFPVAYGSCGLIKHFNHYLIFFWGKNFDIGQIGISLGVVTEECWKVNFSVAWCSVAVPQRNLNTEEIVSITFFLKTSATSLRWQPWTLVCSVLFNAAWSSIFRIYFTGHKLWTCARNSRVFLFFFSKQTCTLIDNCSPDWKAFPVSWDISELPQNSN